MAAVVSRSAIRSRVRTAARQTNSSGFVSDDDLDAFIKEGIDELYDMLVDARGADYYSEKHEFNTEADVANYDLPEDFYRLVSVAISDQVFVPVEEEEEGPGRGDDPVWLTQPTRWRECPRAILGDLAKLYSRDGSRFTSLNYHLTGTQNGGPTPHLRFYPTPKAVFGVRLLYVPVCSHVEGDGDVNYDGISGWEAFVVYRTVAIVAMMQQQDARFWIGEREAVRARIHQLAADRDQAQPIKIADRLGGSLSDIHPEILEDLLWRG